MSRLDRPEAPLGDTVRRARRWTIALTVVMGFIVVTVAIAAVRSLNMDRIGAFRQRYYETESLTLAARDENPGLIKTIEDRLAAEFGDGVESMDVYEVTLADEGDDPPTPFALTYRLRGTTTDVSGLGGDISDFDFAGLVPGTGRVDGELNAAEFKALVVAYAQHSDKPMGYSYPYTSGMTHRDYHPKQTITVGQKTYRVDDLWSVNEGWVPPKSATRWTQDLPHVRAYVFLRDRAAGTFTYVGSEPSLVPVYPWFY